MEYERFFAELAPRVETAGALERELDRKLAHRFNAFDYLRDDELGLSRIIADLLNPEAKHGQGTLFLQTLLSLDGLKNIRHWPKPDKSRPIPVTREQQTHDARRIDISVEIPGADGKRYCLALENKPYAGDQENQVKDYLKYLKQKYLERFLLIYLSPTGEGPSEWSLPTTELGEWEGRFAIMPYYGDPEEQEDQFKAFRIPHSLADWLGECQKNCEVDRLRWFLRDFETFCQRTFGGQCMTTSTEREATAEFVLSNPSNLKTALAVCESWPNVKNRVCEKFLNRLRSRIETAVKENEKLKGFADMRVKHDYGSKAWESGVYLYGECWTRYTEGERFDGRTAITLQNASQGPKNWGIGVCSPLSCKKMTSKDEERRRRLNKGLAALGCGEITPDWPCWMRLDKGKANFDLNEHVMNLHQENENKENQGDEITRYFVDKFTEIAEKAIPIINEIEGGKA